MKLGPPVLPDADEARQWAEDELAKSEYREGGESWLQKVQQWFVDRFQEIAGWNPDLGFGSAGGVITIVIIVLVIGAALWLVIGPLRRARGTRVRRQHSVFEDDHRPAKVILSAAEDAAMREDWRTAVIEAYRALVRSLEERDLIEDLPGITAHEAAVTTGARFSDVAMPMLAAADAFDSSRYGHSPVSRADYDNVRATHKMLAGRTLLTQVSS